VPLLIFDNWPISVMEDTIVVLDQARYEMAWAGYGEKDPTYSDIAHLAEEIRAALNVARARRTI
jgi:hypothetical protein